MVHYTDGSRKHDRLGAKSIAISIDFETFAPVYPPEKKRVLDSAYGAEI